MVTKCPQKIVYTYPFSSFPDWADCGNINIYSAVLSKYSTLPSFLETMPGVIPPNYDNMGSYACELLDAYTDYQYFIRNLKCSTLSHSPFPNPRLTLDK
jgi:hypothetical protein